MEQREMGFLKGIKFPYKLDFVQGDGYAKCLITVSDLDFFINDNQVKLLHKEIMDMALQQKRISENWYISQYNTQKDVANHDHVMEIVFLPLKVLTNNPTE